MRLTPGEPEEGLSPVDREYHVAQGEICTEEPAGTPGPPSESFDRLIDERPTYCVFDGPVGVLTEHHPLVANVGKTCGSLLGWAAPAQSRPSA